MRSIQYNRRGLTLVELLVVMLILVIGIFSIARIFPLGLRSLNHARNTTLADRLAQAEVERWKAGAANVPDGILAENPDPTVIRDTPYTDYNPDDMSTANASQIPSGDETWQWSNVNKVRLIRGETTTIPAPTLLSYADQTGPSYAYSIYNLKFAPIEYSKDTGGTLPPNYTWPDQHVLIYGDPLARTDVTGEDADAISNTMSTVGADGYGIDYTAGTLYFRPVPWDRNYKVDYSYWNGSVLTPYTEVFQVPKDTSGSGDPDSKPLQHGNIDQYSDRCAHKFSYVDPGMFNRFDAYQFTILNGYNQFDFAPTIGFNPIGENRMVNTNLGNRPLTAHIDYRVLNWHVIREDRTMPPIPANGSYSVRLTLPGIKRVGESDADLSAVYGAPNSHVTSSVYTGLTPTLSGYSVVALDLNDDTLMVNGAAGSGNLVVNHAAGIVTVPQKVTKYTPFGGTLTDQDISGHDVRFFYQAIGDWAVQVTKAWANYQQSSPLAGAFENLQYNNFDVEIVPPGGPIQYQAGASVPSDKWSAILTFPRSNAGQSVAVSMNWTDNDGAAHQITGQQYELPTFGTLGSGYPYIVVPFAPTGQYTKPASGEEWKNPYFTFVQGASLKVRTVWRDTPRRWESRTLETFLNRQ